MTDDINLSLNDDSINIEIGQEDINITIEGGVGSSVSAPFIVVAQDGSGDYNGTTETPINDAIAFLASTGGTIFIKRGTYNLSARLNVYSNIQIVGEGLGTILYVNAANIDAIHNEDESGGNVNILIKDLKIDGNQAIHSSDVHAVRFVNVENCSVLNCWLRDTYGDGIYYSGADNCNVFGNTVEECRRNGISFGEASTTPSVRCKIIANHVIGGCVSAAIDLEPCQESVVADNVVEGVENNGIAIVRGITFSEESTFITVQGNYVKECGAYGIYVNNNNDIAISGNIVESCVDRNIYARNTCLRLSIQGNISRLSSSSGIELATVLYSSIVGNVSEMNANYGIMVSTNSTRNSITGNTAVNNSTAAAGVRDGIRLDSSSYNTVVGNVCYDNQMSKTQNSGIKENGTSDNNIITSNMCNGNSGTGVVIIGASTEQGHNIE